jgi:GMC oxidoreductase
MTRGPGASTMGFVTEHYDVIIVGIGAGGGTLAHQAGTCRFGADPATSVLDVNCKTHELNNPALTAMATAIRVGEHLLSRMSRTSYRGGDLVCPRR